MFDIFDGKDKDGQDQFLVRKSKWLFFSILSKVFFFSGIFAIFLRGVFKMKKVLQKDYYFVQVFFGLALLALIFYYFVRLVVKLVSYFYDVFIVTPDKIYKFKVGFWFKENVDIIELYRVQEIRSVCDGFSHLLLNMGHIVLVENNKTERTINWIDNPKKVVNSIQNVKDELIEKRSYNNKDDKEEKENKDNS